MHRVDFEAMILLRIADKKYQAQVEKVRNQVRELQTKRTPAKKPKTEKATLAANPRILRPLGSRLLSIVSFIYSKKTVDRVFSQVITDTREEFLEALAAGNLWHARWIHVRGVLSFLTTVVVHAGSSAMATAVRVITGI